MPFTPCSTTYFYAFGNTCQPTEFFEVVVSLLVGYSARGYALVFAQYSQYIRVEGNSYQPVSFDSLTRQYTPVVFDVTHSIQRPGGLGGKSGGDRQFAPYLAKAAAAVGVDGFFIETHPNPEKALSDGPNMVPLGELREFVKMIFEFWKLNKNS